MSSAARASVITFVVSFVAYLLTLAPGVTLEFSGSLVSAADNLGIGNCPGFPHWTMIAWVFCRVFSFVRDHGEPNPAWAVNVMSAIFASLTCAAVTWTVATFGRAVAGGREDRTRLLLPLAAIAAGLLLTATPALWHFAVVADTVSFYIFFTTLYFVAALLYVQTGRTRWLIAMGALFGTFWLNIEHNYLLALLIPCVIALREPGLLKPLLPVLGVAVVAGCMAGLCIGGTVAFVVATVLTAWLAVFVAKQKTISALFTAFVLSHLPWLYLPLASAQNPPKNWGVAHTLEGFLHCITRGQYESADWFGVLKNPAGLPEYIGGIASTAWLHLGAPALLLVGCALWHLRARPNRGLLFTLLASAVLTPIALSLVQLESWDITHRAFTIFLWLPFLVTLAMLAGLGLIAVTSRMTPRAGLLVARLALAALPLLPIYRGFIDAGFMLMWGGSNQRGHNFGRQFGEYILEGAPAIRSDLGHLEAIPDLDYPPPMERDAIYFGGTDPGRFVIEYMTFSAKVRPDVRVLTQNALADNTYMDHLRRFLGDDIWIPTQQDSNATFQEFVAAAQAGQIPGAMSADGRIQMQGVASIMQINALLARKIFEANKDRHAFYVEEGYLIPWMVPYLEPHGLIFRMRNEPLNGFDPELVRKDQAFWQGLTRRLLADPNFFGDFEARKTFSKLHSANAGLYLAHGVYGLALRGFRQAVALYPLSPEANFRLADAHMQQAEFTQARRIIENYLALDPRNGRIEQFLNQIKSLEATNWRRIDLEKKLSIGGDMATALELLEAYRVMNMTVRFDGLVDQIAKQPGMPLDYLDQLARSSITAERHEKAAQLLQTILEQNPKDAAKRLQLARELAVLNRLPEAEAQLRRAIAHDPAQKSAATSYPANAPLRRIPTFFDIVL